MKFWELVRGNNKVEDAIDDLDIATETRESQAVDNVVALRKFKRPEGVVPGKPSESPQDYYALAKRLGFSPRQLIRAEIMEFFNKNGIKLYEHDKVSRYMDRLVYCHETATCWIWNPLRAKDYLGYDDDGYGYVISYKNGYLYDSRDTDIIAYEKLVPERVLRNVEKIEKKFGDKVAFFVTDYADQRPDPFIGVLIRRDKGDYTDFDASEEMMVFDVWDEPGFGG